MPTLIENLNLIESCKLDIKSAIEDKGVDMTGVSFPGYAEKIGEIETGGGGEWDQVSVTEKNFQITNLNNSASYVASYAFINDTTIQKVNLKDCLIVYNSAFSNCINLSEVSLPNCIRLEYHAFGYCSSLSSVSLPKCEFVSNEAFRNCKSLSYICLPECSYVGAYAFQAAGVISVDLPKVSYIGPYAFSICSLLSDISVPLVREIAYYAFYSCSMLSEITLPQCFSLGNSVFYSCSMLSEITLPQCIRLENNVFYSCSLLSQMTIGTDTYAVASYGNNCLGLTPLVSGVGSIYVPACNYDRWVSASGWSSISSRIVGVGDPSDYLLSYSDGLVYGRTKDLFNGFYQQIGVNSASIISISLSQCYYFEVGGPYAYMSPFISCQNLTTVTLDSCTVVNSNMFNNMRKLKEVILPNCTIVSAGAFTSCYLLSSIYIPSCKYIYSNGFAYCGVNNINLPECEYVSRFAFYSCGSLSYVNLPVCSIIGAYAFEYCFVLKTVDLGSCKIIENWAFDRCSVMSEIIVRTSEVCSINANTFTGTSLNTGNIYVPESLVSDYQVAQYWSDYFGVISPILADLQFRDGLVYGWASYLDSTYLNELGISAGDVTSVSMSRLTSIASSTFMNHYNMVSYDIPLLAEYPDDAFNGCSELSELKLRVNVGERTFANCTGVEVVSLYTSIVGDNAFENCTGLTKVDILYDGLVTAGSDIFSNCTSLSEIYVPYGMLETYTSAEGWSQYSSLMIEGQPWLAFSDGLVWGSATYLDSTFKTTLGITSNQVVSVSLPECVSVGRSCFLEFHALKDVYLPKCEYLDNGAFYGANYMNGIDLPVCSYIGDYAFYWVTYSMSYLKLGYSGVCTLEGGNALYQTSTLRSIYVPASLVDAYKSAPYWSARASMIQPIPE